MKKRNIALIILFSIITFGIYYLYWFVKLTNDSNTMNPKEATTSGGKALLFSIITFGIYTFYWMYKLGEKVDKNGTLYLIISLLGFGFIMELIAQSKVNAYIDDHAATTDNTATDAE